MNATSMSAPPGNSPKLLDQVRQRARDCGHSQQAANSFAYWSGYFILFHNKRHPKDLGMDLQHCRQSLGASAPATPEKKTVEQWLLELMGIDITVCPQCGSRELQRTHLPKAPFVPAAIAGHARDPPEVRT